MSASSIEACRPLAGAGRVRVAFLTWIVFAAGGFAIAVLTYTACGEIFLAWSTFWDGPFTGSVLGTLAIGVPLVGTLQFFYGCGFVTAYLSGALGFAAGVAALSVWQSGRVAAARLAGLLLVSPVLVFAQASIFGTWFDPGSETMSDGLTPRSVLIYAPLLIPALVGPWFLIRRRIPGDPPCAFEATAAP